MNLKLKFVPSGCDLVQPKFMEKIWSSSVNWILYCDRSVPSPAIYLKFYCVTLSYANLRLFVCLLLLAGVALTP